MHVWSNFCGMYLYSALSGAPRIRSHAPAGGSDTPSYSSCPELLLPNYVVFVCLAWNDQPTLCGPHDRCFRCFRPCSEMGEMSVLGGRQPAHVGTPHGCTLFMCATRPAIQPYGVRGLYTNTLRQAAVPRVQHSARRGALTSCVGVCIATCIMT